MYLVRNEVTAVPGRALDFEAVVRRLNDQLKSQKGFDRGGFGVSYSYPGRYAGLYLWQSREDAQAFYRGPDYQARLREIMPLINIAQPARAYEQVHAVVDPANAVQSAGCIMLIDLTAAAGKGAGLEENVKQAYEVRKQHGKGFITNRLVRAVGNPFQYLSYWVHTSRDDLLATLDTAQVQQHRQAHPVTEFTAGGAVPAIDQFEVLHVVASG